MNIGTRLAVVAGAALKRGVTAPSGIAAMVVPPVSSPIYQDTR